MKRDQQPLHHHTFFFFFSLFSFSLLSSSLTTGQPVFDAARAFMDLERQCSFGPRTPGSEGHRRCLEWLTETMTELTPEIYLQPFEGYDPLGGKRRQLTNIIARFPGEGGMALMLCAHWDTRPWADRDPDPDCRRQPILGANDGASGVAVLLEMARIAALHPPPMTLLIVLFDGEDMGRASQPEEFALGSSYWAMHQIPEPVCEAILLDLVGDADLELPVEPLSDANAPALRSNLWELARRLALPAFVETFGPPVYDDHIPLQKVGIRAVDIVDFDYPYWHTLADTPDKCSPESLKQVGSLLVEFIYGD